MAEFTQQQNAPFNAYSWIENDYLNRQAGIADQAAQNQQATRLQDTYEMEQPRKVAESGLARMVAERDQRLMPLQEEVATQNIDAEKNFNRLRQMRALMDDDSIDQGQKEQLLRNGLMRSAGISGQPTLQDAQKMARIQYAIDEARNNPDMARQRLDKAMEAYSRTAKSTQQQDLAQTRGNIQHTNTLLRGQVEEAKARLKNTLGQKDAKSYQELKMRDVQALRRMGKYEDADIMEQAYEGLIREGATLKRDVTQEKPIIDTSGGAVTIKAQPVTPATRVPTGSRTVAAPASKDKVIRWTKDAQGRPIRVQE